MSSGIGLVPSTRRIPWGLYVAVLVISATLAVWHLGSGLTEHGLQMFTRHTARESFFLFLLPFLATPLGRTFPSSATRLLARKRRYLGLAFALSHFIHLGALISYSIWTGIAPGIVTLVGGGSVYVLIAAMALTSNDWSMRKLGRNWKRLHTFGMYSIWFIFAQSYLGRVVSDGSGKLTDPSDPIAYRILFTIAVAALAFRVLTTLAQRKRATRSATARPEQPDLAL